MLQVDPIQSYLNLKIGLHPFPLRYQNAGSSGTKNIIFLFFFSLQQLKTKKNVSYNNKNA